VILTLISWNTNGLLARMEKGDLIPLLHHNPEIVCFQETRVAPPDVAEWLRTLYGYRSWFSPLWEDRYYGVGMIARISPKAVSFSAGDPRTDGQGRIMLADFQAFTLINVYVPAGDGGAGATGKKLAFLDGLLDTVARLQNRGSPVVVCGDFCIAHTDQDLSDPAIRMGYRNPGMTVEERARLDRLIGLGFIDPFRMIDRENVASAGWRTGHGLRQQDLCWRRDYFFISSELRDRLKSCSALKDVRGFDHNPVLIEFEIAEDTG
jgi:exodeoxyribonuclease-3